LALVVLLPAKAVAGAGTKAGPRHHGSDRDEARRRFERGVGFYNHGQFDLAIEEFRRAYQLSDAPGLLFNIAKAYRAKQDCVQALQFFRSYLRAAPDASNAGEARDLIGECERSEAATATDSATPGPAETRLVEPPAAPPASALQPAATAPGPDATSTGGGRTLKLTGLVVASAGVALIAAGVTFALQSSSTADDLTAMARGGETWTPALRQKYDDGQSQAELATVLSIAGGAALVGGGVLAWLGYRRATHDSELTIAPLPGGTRMVLTCRF
jgi:hypothetical protein